MSSISYEVCEVWRKLKGLRYAYKIGRIARDNRRVIRSCYTKAMSISKPNSANGKPSTASSNHTVPSIEKHPIKRSAKGYNFFRQMPPSIMTITPGKKSFQMV
jgi:hypothetical protein